MTDYKEISTKIIEAVSDFEEQLLNMTRFRHTDARAHGDVIKHFAEAIIDAEFTGSKMEIVKTTFELLKGLANIEESI